MATNMYENEGAIDNPPPFNPDCSNDTVIYEVFEPVVPEITPKPQTPPDSKIEFDPIIAYEYPDTTEDDISNLNLNFSETRIGDILPQTGTQVTSIKTEIPENTPNILESIPVGVKFHKTILFIYELYTLQSIENLALKLFKNSPLFSRVSKVFIQIVVFVYFLILTGEVNRELFVEYRAYNSNQTDTLSQYKHIDIITIIISIAFSLLSLISLAFLFIYSNILTETGVLFQPWTLHSFKASWLSSCVLIAIYIFIFIWFVITNIWKCFINIYTLGYFQFSTFGVIFFSILFLFQGLILHSSPFVLCFMIRSICKQLHYETDCMIEGVKKCILNMVVFDPGFSLKYFDQMARMLHLNGRVKLIATVNIITVFFVVSTIFLSAFNDKDGVLNVGENNGFLPQVAYLWLVFVSCYLLILTLWMIQGITALNMKINKFSDLILIDKQVRQQLTGLETENLQNFLEIRRNLNFISTNKSRFQVGIFGDLTNSFFHSIVVFGLVLMLPFILKIPIYIQTIKL